MDNTRSSPAINYCGSCGKKLLSNASFCAYCGAQVPKIEVAHTPYTVIERPFEGVTQVSPPATFLEHFRGVVLSPKEEFSRIVSNPRFSHAFYLNILIGILSAFSMMLFLSKIEIVFSDTFMEIFPPDSDISIFREYFSILLILFSPLLSLLGWILSGFVLWILLSISASDLRPDKRNYRIVATIVGWSLYPMILLQLGTIAYHAFLLPGGEMLIQTMTTTEIIYSSGISETYSFLLAGLDIFLQIWSISLVYLSIKSLGPTRSNPFLICAVYGILIFILRIFLSV
jgi:hypothetical protein